jgi:translation initiation factor 3 subunit B
MGIEKTPSAEGSAASDSDHESGHESEPETEARYEHDYEEEPDFSDPEDFVDDVDDATLMPDLLRQRPKESDGVDNVVLVDGIPCVSADRLEKLKSVLRKIFSKVGCTYLS